MSGGDGRERDLGVGVVGAGRMGAWHLAKLATIDGVRVVGVCDVDLERARVLSARFGGCPYPVLAAMLEDAELDALYVCNPARHHPEAVIEAAKRGLDLFVEKPLALNLADARAMVRAVETAGVVCTVGYQYRYLRCLDRVAQALGDASLSLVRGHWYWTIPPVPATRSKAASGGPVVDQLTHLIDLARLFAGEVERVTAEYTLNTWSPDELDNWDGSAVLVRFAGGAVGTFSSTLSLYPSLPATPNVDYIGLDLVARDQFVRFTPERVTRYRDHEVVEWTGLGGDIDAEFVAACRARDPGRVRAPIREAYHSLAVGLASNESARTGAPVVMSEFLRAQGGPP